jgi:hypothetical protein
MRADLNAITRFQGARLEHWVAVEPGAVPTAEVHEPEIIARQRHDQRVVPGDLAVVQSDGIAGESPDTAVPIVDREAPSVFGFQPSMHRD